MPDQPNPQEKLEKVFDAEQESEALVVRGLLESNGIEAMVRPIDLEQDLFPVGGVGIYVRQEQAEQARRLIADHRANELPEDAPEEEFSGGPSSEA
jgi:hypothetical protein